MRTSEGPVASHPDLPFDRSVGHRIDVTITAPFSMQVQAGRWGEGEWGELPKASGSSKEECNLDDGIDSHLSHRVRTRTSLLGWMAR